VTTSVGTEISPKGKPELMVGADTNMSNRNPSRRDYPVQQRARETRIICRIRPRRMTLDAIHISDH
jgi:hypothetical protein